ncbi:MAG: sodium:alanine symporter family protein [Gammaproteobacteria bacterium]|nr:MAG: sodium:alanine symporter family protein [Gammaproteobacteria bacterium]
MEDLYTLIARLSGFIWGPYGLIPLLVITGIYLTIGLRAMPWRHIGVGFRMLWRGRKAEPDAPGLITPFQSLMTALSATIGTGNIAGVATAIYSGGPGAVFWLWVIALFGMATKYAEAVLAVNYREVDEAGNHVGGPMYYIKNGMGERWGWLAAAFAVFGMLAALGIGNLVQSNSVALALASNYQISAPVTGLIMALFAAAVILGGIRRIGEVAQFLVPFMAIAYVLAALTIIGLNLNAIPAALWMIVHDAFSGTAAAGGFAGASVAAAIRFGVARGVFSNESGLGSAPIAHAAAKTKDPVRQGKIAMLGTFIDTIIICTMTALVILITGAWTSGLTSSELSSVAFGIGLPGFGNHVVTLGLVLFAFTTILGWSYYGERCVEYLFGIRMIMPYRFLWLVVIVIGALLKDRIDIVWDLADILNGLMALPNLIALLVLSPVVFKLTKAHKHA